MDPMPSRTTRTAYLVLTILFLIAVVAGLVVVAHRLFGFGQDSSRLSVPAAVAVSDVELPQTFEIAGPLPVTVDVVGPSVAQRALATLPALAWWALTLAVLWLVRGIARSAARGDPFRASNVVRLRGLGALFLLGFPLASIVERYCTDRFFSDRMWTGGSLPQGGIVSDSPVVSGAAVMAAVSLFALAEVFAFGAKLREDVDATI
jgi:hypothetical protein